ncbi:MAG: hypothetical protein QQN63_00830 [Nitrosopumilus sp.]
MSTVFNWKQIIDETRTMPDLIREAAEDMSRLDGKVTMGMLLYVEEKEDYEVPMIYCYGTKPLSILTLIAALELAKDEIKGNFVQSQEVLDDEDERL